MERVLVDIFSGEKYVKHFPVKVVSE